MGRSKSRRGFALLITITLLAFLVLLLVSLASLTRVETQVASNTQQLAQARQNALMALNIAIGQLQKYAGPDQRVTATADIAGTATGTAVPAGGNAVNSQSSAAPDGTRVAIANGIATSSSVQLGTRYWTGVWGNYDTPTSIYKQSPAPVLLNWLVSGNENPTTPFSFDSSTGRITSQSITAPYSPSMAVTPALTTTTTATTALKINGNNAVMLVGPQTVGTATGATDRYIAAPLVNIQSSNVPGLGNTPATIGRYAYWIGDEGVKAQYNLRDSLTATDPATSADARYRLRTPARDAIELVAGDTGSTSAYLNYPINNPLLDKIKSQNQLRFADTNLALPDQQVRFHDLTTASWGVLANSQTGGLRTDLTHALSQTTLGVNFSGKTIIPSVTPTGFTQPVAPAFGAKWETLKSFYDLTTNAGNATTANPVAIRPATATTMGISPVIVQNRLAFGIDFTPKDTTSVARRFYICVSAAFVLSNPYTFPIQASSGLDFSYAITTATGAEWGINLDRRDTAGAVNVPPFNRAKYPAKTALGNATTYYPVLINKISFGPDSATSVLGNVKFHIPSITLQPGEIKVFTIPDTTGAPGPIVTLQEGVYFGYYKHDTGTDVPAHIGSASQGYFLRMLSAGAMTLQMALGGSNALDGLAPQPQAGALELVVNADLSADNATSAGNNTNNQVAPKPTAFNTIFPATVTPADFSGYAMSLALPDADTTFYDPTYAGSRMGSHRAYADYNLTALNFALPPVAPLLNTTNAGKNLETVPPYTRQYIQSGGQVLSGGSATPLGSNSFKNGLLTTLGWGNTTAPSGKPTTVLYDVPKRVTPDEAPLFSIGQLQHADLTGDDNYLSVSYQPRNAVGNSAYNIYAARSASIDSRPRASPQPNGVAASGNVRMFDLSYLLNTALWDNYFFSSLIQTGDASAVGTIANQRLAFSSSYHPTNAQLGIGAGDTTVNDLSGNGTQLLPEMAAARYMMIKGAFNINSTSVNAWKAALAGARNLALSTDTTGTPFARSLNQPLSSVNAEQGDQASTYAGYRRLTDGQIATLATNIVAEIRKRGPFVSLAHFINRQIGATTDPLTANGALQAAIDASTLNPFPNPTPTRTATTSAFGGAITAYAANTTATNLGNCATATPGWLTQADILQSLGPVLSARSDTFTIRVYGDVINPLDQTTVLSRVWCEATVQRFPDYVDSTISAALSPNDTHNTAPNNTFGRRFRVVSFRWLTPTDI